MTVHLDDFMQEVEDEDQERLALRLAIGGRRLAATLQKELKLSIAMDKCALAAITPQVAALVRKQLQGLDGSAPLGRARTTILGVEAAAGSRAPCRARAAMDRTRAQRFSKAKLRAKRISRLAKVDVSARKPYTTGAYLAWSMGLR